MRKLFLLFAVLFLVSLPARAQDSYPTAEVFGGYSYFSIETGVDIDPDFDDDFDDIFLDDLGDREGFHGFGFSVAGNISRSVGIVGDFSYNRKSVETILGDVDLSTLVFLFGPRFTARGERANGFGHVLVGGVRGKVSSDLGGFSFDLSETDFALGLGGGVDIKATDSIGIRLFQLDYIPVKGEDEWSHNFRFQAGVVFRLGGD